MRTACTVCTSVTSHQARSLYSGGGPGGAMARVRGYLYGGDSNASWVTVTWWPLWTDRLTHKHNWKHYLSATSLAGGKYIWVWLSFSLNKNYLWNVQNTYWIGIVAGHSNFAKSKYLHKSIRMFSQKITWSTSHPGYLLVRQRYADGLSFLSSWNPSSQQVSLRLIAPAKQPKYQVSLNHHYLTSTKNYQK